MVKGCIFHNTVIYSSLLHHQIIQNIGSYSEKASILYIYLYLRGWNERGGWRISAKIINGRVQKTGKLAKISAERQFYQLFIAFYFIKIFQILLKLLHYY